MGKLLTETAPYDESGSWGRVAHDSGWPEVKGDSAYDMYVFANCVQSIPYGSYVLISQRGEYGATESVIAVDPDRIEELKADFIAAGLPRAEDSVARRERDGELNDFGNRKKVSKWWVTWKPCSTTDCRHSEWCRKHQRCALEYEPELRG